LPNGNLNEDGSLGLPGRSGEAPARKQTLLTPSWGACGRSLASGRTKMASRTKA